MRERFFTVPEGKQVRVIVDTDAACECDDQYAIAHALMSPKVEVRGVIAEHFREPGSMERSYEEIRKLLALMELPMDLAYRGCDSAMVSEKDAQPSEGTDFIIEEARRGDLRPLFVICQGAVTNVASALVKAPEIGKYMTILWVGGSNYPLGGYEFNTLNDIHASNALLASDADIWMLPAEVYSTLQVGLEELYMKVAPCGALGKYLFDHTMKGNERISQMLMAGRKPQQPADYLAFPNGGSWNFGDSCAIGLLLSTNSGSFEMKRAPRICMDGRYEIPEDGKMIRYYTSVNTRFILEDFFAKLAYYFK